LRYAHHYLDGEVRYTVLREYAQRAVDVLARRIRLTFLDVQAAASVLPAVIGIMVEELEWGEVRKHSKFTESIQFLRSIGLEGETTDALLA
jgi:glycerol-3-phosphate dehydrogenase